MENNLRFIPKMDELIVDAQIEELKKDLSHKIVVNILRQVLEQLRLQMKNGQITITDKKEAYNAAKNMALQAMNQRKLRRLRPVINATGTIIHTNLGRVPLSNIAIDAVVAVASGYSNLEYATDTGTRSNRTIYIEELLKELLQVEAALVVNNNAAAVFLTLNTLCKNREVIVSRGEIVEIGGSFRVSEIIHESGCYIKEVGTTNKTHLIDYQKAITEQTSALLKVHRSNFKIIGFTKEVLPKELVSLKNENEQLITIEDMGSGVLVDITKYNNLPKERTVEDAIKDNVDIITFSGDKVLGGPQAGIIVGKKEYINLIKKNQLLRCMRLDKMSLAALEATLWQYTKEDYNNIPVLNKMGQTLEIVHKKAVDLAKMLNTLQGVQAIVIKHYAVPGGGALPEEVMDSYAVSINIEKKSSAYVNEFLRNMPVPIISITENNSTILNLHTLNQEDFLYIKDTFAQININGAC